MLMERLGDDMEAASERDGGKLRLPEPPGPSFQPVLARIGVVEKMAQGRHEVGFALPPVADEDHGPVRPWRRCLDSLDQVD